MKIIYLTIISLLLISTLQDYVQTDVQIKTDFSENVLNIDDIKGWNIKNNLTGGLISKCSANKDFSNPEEVFGLQQNFNKNTKITKTFNTGVKPTKCYIVFDLYLYNFAYDDQVIVTADDQEVYVFECNKIDQVKVKKTKCYDKYYNQNMGVSIIDDIRTNSFIPDNKKVKVNLDVNFKFKDTFWGIKNFSLFCDFNRCPSNQTLDKDEKTCICMPNFIARSQDPLICIKPPKCHPSCLNCPDTDNVCNQCPANSVLSEDKSQCVCKQGFIQKSSSPLVCEHEIIKIDCPLNSTLQPSLQVCQCDSGYFAFQNNPLQCKPKPQCHASCLQCAENSDICIECPENGNLSQDLKQCLCPLNSSLSKDHKRCECPMNSSYDKDIRQCQCNQGFYKVQSRVFMCRRSPTCNSSCLQCKSEEDNTCVKCPANSQVSQDGKTCNCDFQYIATQLDPLKCIKESNIVDCPPNSYTPDSITCICYDNFYPSSTLPLECSPIQDCDPSCAQCSFDGKCDQCIDDFIVNEDGKSCRDKGCHPSCECYLQDDQCSSQQTCIKCKQPQFTQMVGKDFCQCLTPKYRLKKGSTWECEEVDLGIDIPECEWQLFNQISRMVVHSNCGILVNEKQANIVYDVVSFDWRRVNSVNLSEECKSQLKVQLLWAQDCQKYVAFNQQYFTQINQNQLQINIPLIDVYNLTNNTVLTADGRTIYQILCFAIELSHARKTLRQHRFQMRIYTNRDQVEVFHLDVTQIVTKGCDNGQECIIVADLDTKGNICNDPSCNSFKPSNVIPTYTIGQHMYVRIQFQDNSFKKFLTVTNVKFVDDHGIYTYVKNVQYWTINQQPGLVDIDVYLFQPYQNAILYVELKIALNKDLRVLQTNDERISEQFKVNVLQNKTQNVEDDKNKSYGMNLIFSAFSLIILYLI